MSLHKFEYTYNTPEWGAIALDIDEDLDLTEKEAIAIAEIKELYEDVTDIEIIKITVEN